MHTGGADGCKMGAIPEVHALRGGLTPMETPPPQPADVSGPHHEAAIYRDATDFLSDEFDAEVVVEVEADEDGAVPFRPSIELEAA